MHKRSQHHADETDSHDELSGAQHRWLLPVLLVAQLMVILDITAVNIALPHIATDLQLSGSSLSWTITSYSVIFGSLLLFGGRAADLLGRRRMFLTGLGVFTASSFASAMAGSAGVLFAARAGQGLGAAMLSPAALSPTSLAAIVYGITQADSAGWTSVQTHLCGLGGLAGLAAFAIYELHIDAPLLRVERIADRAVGGGLLLMLLAAGSIFGLFLLCSLYLQGVLGMGPLATGFSFIPLAVSAGVGAHLAGHLIARHGVRGPLAGAFLVGAVGMFLLSRVSTSGSYLSDVLPGMLVAGLGLGVAVVTVSVAILTGSRAEEAGMLSGLNSTGHEIGGTLGIAIFSTIAAGASGSILGPHATSGIGHAFLVAALVATLGSLVAIAILPRAKHFLPKMRLNPQAMPIH